LIELVHALLAEQSHVASVLLCLDARLFSRLRSRFGDQSGGILLCYGELKPGLLSLQAGNVIVQLGLRSQGSDLAQFVATEGDADDRRQGEHQPENERWLHVK